MGLSFGRFGLRARLGLAAHCLASTHLSLERIAERAGFANPGHLRETFRKHFGANPASYREQLRGHARAYVSANVGEHQHATSRASVHCLPPSPHSTTPQA